MLRVVVYDTNILLSSLLYQKGEVTLGRAAELAGIHRYEFEEALAARDIWKIVEVDSAETLRARIAHIKRLHKSNPNK